jgi:hypothetical protein
MTEWPEWWGWELELSPHMLKRMLDRVFNEVDLRVMLESARDYRPDHEEGRWVIETVHADKDWEVIVEPVFDEQVLVAVTAYPVG